MAPFEENYSKPVSVLEAPTTQSERILKWLNAFRFGHRQVIHIPQFIASSKVELDFVTLRDTGITPVCNPLVKSIPSQSGLQSNTFNDSDQLWPANTQFLRPTIKRRRDPKFDPKKSKVGLLYNKSHKKSVVKKPLRPSSNSSWKPLEIELEQPNWSSSSNPSSSLIGPPHTLSWSALDYHLDLV